MRVCLIMPPMPFGWTPVAPPILEYLGALTKKVQPDVELELIDGSATEVIGKDIDADIVGISSLTSTAYAAYTIADYLRKRGIKVVLGGMHPSALPEEAKGHADSVVVGEAESVWGTVLEDARKGELKSFYYGEALPLVDLPAPLYGYLKGRYRFSSVFTSRGCPFNCTFCSVKQFFGKTIRYRPIDDVVRDVESIPSSIYMISDENVWSGKIQRAVDLFTELKGSKKKWLGFGNLGAVESPLGDKLLKTARDSGLITLWIGWEALSDEVLNIYHAKAKIGSNREEAIKKIKDNGIDVSIFIMLGGRSDSLEDFEHAIELADRLGVSIHLSLVVPYPGTKLFEEYEPFINKDLGWEFFTGSYAVYEHPLPEMTHDAREQKFYETSLELLSLRRILKHLVNIPLSGFPTTHIVSLMSQLPVRHGMKVAFNKWKLNRGVLDGKK